MRRILLFGNSGSGKSTLASRLAAEASLAHLDLDTLAWLPSDPPQRKPLHDSKALIEQFVGRNGEWVVEGCYADLLEMLAELATEVLFLDIPVEQCVQNAKSRPWEPHKYASKEAQDANLEMLLAWIGQYESRTDVFSKAAHCSFYERFAGRKTRLLSNEDARAYG